ncbi:MAG: type II secretion system F family protein [Myxococcota bacterium]
MIDAGLPLVQCLEILGSQEPHPLFQKIVLDVKRSVESGSTLADALAKHPKVFDNLFVNLIQAGERRYPRYHPQPARGLHREGRQAEAEGQVGDEVPGDGAFVSLTISGFLLIKVIPAFGEMFTSMGKNLPALTQQVMKVSAWTVENTPLLVGIIVSPGGGRLQRPAQVPETTVLISTFLLKVPVAPW